MDPTGVFKRRSLRHQIDETAARLARRKRTLASRGSQLTEALRGELTSHRVFMIAGSTGYLIGELSRPNPCTEQSPDRSRPPGSLFNDLSLWLNTAFALAKWAHEVFDTPLDPNPSDKREVSHHTPPAA